MRLAYVACGNGLGHVKRTLRMIAGVQAAFGSVQATLFCEAWQLGRLRGWAYLDNVDVVTVDLPMRWYADPGQYGDWLLSWHTEFQGRFDAFDYVLSDNLVEVLHYADRVCLSGSFLWHDVLYQAHPQNPVVATYHEQASALLADRRPPMLVNEWFAMPATGEQTAAQPIGAVPFYFGARATLPDTPKRVLFAPGNSPAAQARFDDIQHALGRLVDAQITLYVGERWYDTLAAQYDNVARYDFVSNPLSDLDAVIMRCGIGTLSDSLAAGVPMYYIDEANPELRHNQNVLVERGCAVPFDVDALLNTETYRRLSQNLSAVPLHYFQGVEHAVEFLSYEWEIR